MFCSDGLFIMENAEFNRILSHREDSRHRFWECVPDADALAAEFVI